MVVERMVPHDFALGSACGTLCGMHDSVRKPSAESCGYLMFVDVRIGGESDEMLGEVLSLFPDSVAKVRHIRPESWR